MTTELEIPDDIRAAARDLPDHLFGLVDPAWRDEDTPPAWAVRGQWRSGADGEITEWLPNPEYRPSPAARGWPEPTDPVDDAVQRAATGYGTAEHLLTVLVAAEVSVPADPSGASLTVRAPDGTTLLPVFSAEDHRARAGAPAGPAVPVADLLPGLDHDLLINPGGAVSMVVNTAEIRRELSARSDAQLEP